MAEEDNFDIYGDLNEFDASVKLKEVRHNLTFCWGLFIFGNFQVSQEFEGLKKKHEVTQKSLETSEAVNKHLKAVVGTVKKNFYVLLNTARTEVKRKDGTIAQLRRDFDDMAFRRTKTKVQRIDRATQTEQNREDSGRRRENGSLMSERGRRTRYDKFRESVIKDQGQKRRHEGDREFLNNPKRRRSRPRSPSRDRNRRDFNRRYRDRSPERHTERRDPKNQRKSREKSEKVENSAKQTNSKGKAKDVPKIEKVQDKEDKSSLDTKNELPEQKLTTPQKIEKIYQENREETLAAVENILRETSLMPQENLSNAQNENPPLPPQEDVAVPPPPPPPVPQEEPKPPEIPENQPNSSDQADSSKETQNVSINMGNSDYSIQKDNQGVVTVFIKRKKRKSK